MAWPCVGRAQHGGVQAQALIDVEGRYGAGVLADALWLDGPVRVGASVGTGALSNAGQDRANVLGLLGPALWCGQPGPGVFGILRVGGFAGAQKGGFLGGLWLAPAVGYRLSIGGDALLRLAAELWLLQGKHTTVVVSPAIGLDF